MKTETPKDKTKTTETYYAPLNRLQDEGVVNKMPKKNWLDSYEDGFNRFADWLGHRLGKRLNQWFPSETRREREIFWAGFILGVIVTILIIAFLTIPPGSEILPIE